MTDKTGNHKIRLPELIITRNMVIDGKIKLDARTLAELAARIQFLEEALALLRA